ncbi:MAG: hypothetical protein IJ335_09360 [Lachnospiraceae bacterium]|nr:hypothetical protein [Lachnospiraceae bacterium]
MFLDMIYDIFRESRIPGERQMRLTEWYKMSHAGEKNTREAWNAWYFSLPYVEKLVQLEFHTNDAVYCKSQSYNGAHHILVPLDGEWQRNEELVSLLLILAQLWGESLPVYQVTVDKYSECEKIQQFLEEKCTAHMEPILQRMREKSVQYHGENFRYLLLDGRIESFKESNAGWGDYLRFRKVLMM